MKRLFLFIVLVLFTQSVKAQKIAVAVEKMNVLYVGIDNPVTPIVENMPCKNIFIETDNGTIKKGYDTCEYIIIPERAERTIIKVFAKIKNSKKLIGEKEFRVKRIPSPIIMLAGREKGMIRKNFLLVAMGPGVGGDAAHFGFRFTIDEYKIVILRNNNTIFEKQCVGTLFDDGIKKAIEKIKTGDKFICTDIKFSGYGYNRELGNSIELTVID